MRRLHLSVEKEHDFYRFMNGITRKTKTLGPIHSSDKEKSEAFNTYLCGIMPPSTKHNINWDVHHEPKKSQLYVAAIPGSTALKPMESDITKHHIIELHKYLKPYGYDFSVGDVIDSYPLGEKPRGQTQIPVILTYKDETTTNLIRAAAKRAGHWDKRRQKKVTREDNQPKGFFTAAYDPLSTVYMSTDDIRDAIRQTKKDSAACPDDLKMTVYSEACDHILGPLQMLYNIINSTGTIPTNFKTARVILLHKKKSKQEMGNYRPIKAFDLLDHGKALTLCHRAGINGNTGRSLENWLIGRRQFVKCSKETSSLHTVGRSCVQGSVLGPTLWLIYIQSLLDRLEHKCHYYTYADDVTIIAKISTKK